MADIAAHPDADGLVGSVTIWPSDILPGAKYRFCEGAAISRTEFSLCFARLGTNHGVGDGLTTFNLPNYKEKFLVGANADDAAYDLVGETGGAASGTTETESAHTHGDGSYQTTLPAGFLLAAGASGVPATGAVVPVVGTSGPGSSHSHSFSTVPPYTVVRYIIKVA